MNKLSSTWFCEGTIDYELKQYTLLAYLQKVSTYFKEKRLYSPLSDLIDQYATLILFKSNTLSIDEKSHKEIETIDLAKRVLNYKDKEIKVAEIEELKDIVEFALEEIKNKVNEGKEIYDTVESYLAFFDVGMVSLNKDEGYIIVSYFNDYHIYSYRMSSILYGENKSIGINLTFLNTQHKNLVTTFENVKLSLIKRNSLTIPSVYGVTFSGISFPYYETVLPIIKREFLVHLKRSDKNSINI